MSAAELVFWASVAVLAYVYAGYPLAVSLAGRLRPRPVRKAPVTPRVTLVIAAHNEEAVIASTLENKLALDYPRGLLEILVVSDGSTDRTDEVVRGLAGRGVELIRQEPRRGKTAALNLAAERGRGEILVFSDANSIYEPGALAALVQNFADPGVGYVTGRMVYGVAPGSSAARGCSAYMRYENRLREWETRAGSVVGVDGGIDAVRARLYRPMAPDDLPDLVLPLRVVAEGYRVVYEPGAVLREEALAEPQAEYAMRVRVALRALAALAKMRGLLNPLRHGLFAWQLWSHKVLRYAAPVFQAAAWVSNLVLLPRPAYAAILALQSLFYAAALVGWAAPRRRGLPRVVTAAFYLCLVNLAAAHALVLFLLGRRQVLWTPRRG